jgi:hypothetical protein
LVVSKKVKKPAFVLSMHRARLIEVVDASGDGGKNENLEGRGDDAE